ncbi:integral membrane protein dgcr2 idd [Limosa lapponica baueri]|uniref:Integral membrane protein dgcr2 idd n=1 Tax=Limosa lapponica baueri TaxID=1758121 RepID=A0A2I0UE93_LIMLA|nr:integral membrane protein dgcr2 idd [Limosa lapponica baueri]
MTAVDEEILLRQYTKFGLFLPRPMGITIQGVVVESNKVSLQPLFPKPVALHGVVVTQVQDPALGLVEPHTIGLGPSIQPIQILLKSLPTLQQINTPTQLGVICKLTEGALDALVQIIDEDIEKNWPQH